MLAVAEGNVAKLFDSKQGGLTVYQFDNTQQYAFYYAHLDHYAPGLKEGMLLRKGDTLGYVGIDRRRADGHAAPALRGLPAGAGETLVEGRGAESAADVAVAGALHGRLRFMRVPWAMLFIAASAYGQILNGLEWRSIGPAATGGRITDIEAARAPGRPAEIYVGTASGGIFKSVNEGVSWTPVFDRAGGMLSIGALAVAPSNQAIVWAGTGEANNRQSTSWGDGVYRSNGWRRDTGNGSGWKRRGTSAGS